MASLVVRGGGGHAAAPAAEPRLVCHRCPPAAEGVAAHSAVAAAAARLEVVAAATEEAARQQRQADQRPPEGAEPARLSATRLDRGGGEGDVDGGGGVEGGRLRVCCEEGGVVHHEQEGPRRARLLQRPPPALRSRGRLEGEGEVVPVLRRIHLDSLGARDGGGAQAVARSADAAVRVVVRVVVVVRVGDEGERHAHHQRVREGVVVVGRPADVEGHAAVVVEVGGRVVVGRGDAVRVDWRAAVCDARVAARVAGVAPGVGLRPRGVGGAGVMGGGGG
mmetsp:Transcript_25507/g.80866  ORF Transcript_25507/g.80866 Transcript_25507/m.80866 type:complete len:278 (-) Transcript_25507:341-1174(-)